MFASTCKCIFVFGVFLLKEHVVCSANHDFELIKTSSGVDYVTAKQMCEDRDMQIASIPKADEEFVILKTYLNTVNIPRDMWIGLYWAPSTEKFYWTDTDTEVTQTLPWYPGEPDCTSPPSSAPCPFGSHGQHCVRLLGSSFFYRTTLCTYDAMDPLCHTNVTRKETVSQISTTETESKTTSVFGTTEADLCTCPCDSKESKWVAILSSNKTTEEIQTIIEEEIAEINKEISVDKTTTSAYIRRRSSAVDRRTSSFAVGVIGISIMVVVISFFVCLDCVSVYQKLFKK